MKKMLIACATVAAVALPLQAVAQSAPAPMRDAKAQISQWTGGQILAVAGGAIVGAIVIDALLPGMVIKSAIGLIGGGALGYFWYSNETPSMMKLRTSETEDGATVLMSRM